MAQTINIIFGATSVGGTADAITAVYSPVLTALTNRRTLSFKAAANNTGAVTFSPDGLTVRSVTKRGGTALIAGDILQNAVYFIQYDSTNTRWELINPSTDNNVIPTFAQVLASGNIVPDGQVITGSGGQIYIDFGNDLYFAVTTDANNYLTPYFYVINDPGGQGVYGVLSNGEYHIGSGDDTFVGKKIWIDSNSAQIVHDVLAKLDAPNINIPNETASRYLYLDASKNIDTKTTAQVLSDIGAQPLDDQLTEIAALSPSNDDFIQEKAGVFTNRTPAQVSADLTANLMNGYQGMELIATGAGVNPADSTVYYIGSPFNIAPTTTPDNRRVYVRKACTIKAADIGIVVAGVLGSAENATIAIRVNNTTDTSISAAVTHTAVYQQFSNAGLSIALNAGDYFEIKITHPAYATNPTNVQTTVMIYAE